MSRKSIFLSVCGLCVFCILLAIFYRTVYSSHLLWQEQNQIFLNTPQWLSTYFDSPAWLGCMAGDWLTQFYHNTVIGAIILSLAVGCCTACCAIILSRLLPRWAALAGTVVFAVLMAACSMSSTTPLAFFMCLAGGLATALPRLWIRCGKKLVLDFSPLLVVPAYWAFGFGALITAIAFNQKVSQQRAWRLRMARRGSRCGPCVSNAGIVARPLCFALYQGFALSRVVSAFASGMGI